MVYLECPFCRKLANLEALAPEDVVWQFPHSVAFLGLWQYYQGYCTLVTRRHATELSQLSEDERRGYLEEMCLLARAIEECFRPHKLNYELLGNQVPHLHWHLFPRYADDPDASSPVWVAVGRAERDRSERRRLRTGPTTRAETADRLRLKIQELTSAKS